MLTLMLKLCIPVALLAACLTPEPDPAVYDDALCVADDPDCAGPPPPPCHPWEGTIYPWCASRSCPLGVSDEPLRYEPCTEHWPYPLCFCRTGDDSTPLTICGLYGDTFVPSC